MSKLDRDEILPIKQGTLTSINIIKSNAKKLKKIITVHQRNTITAAAISSNILPANDVVV